MKMKKMYFKKFMSVFMACIMLLSCWVWIAPEHVHAAIEDTNSTAIASVQGLNTAYTTVNGSFAYDNDYTSAQNYADVYHNVLYTDGTVTSAAATSGQTEYGSSWTGSNGVTVSWYHPTATLIYDGDKTNLPRLGVVVNTVMYYTGTWSRKTVNRLSYIQSGGNGFNFNQNWRGSDGRLNFQYMWHGQSEMMGYTSTVINDEMRQTLTGNSNDHMYGNLLKFTDTMLNTEYYRTATPTFAFYGDNGDVAKTITATTTKPIYIINYVPLRTAIEEAMPILSNIKNNPGKYTVASVTKFVELANALVAAKPNNYINSTKNQVSQWATAAKNAVDAWNNWSGLEEATYKITFTGHHNVNGEIQSDNIAYYKYGEMPVAPGGSNYQNGDYDFTFNGWTPAITTVRDDVVYTADYTMSDKILANYTAVDNAIAAADAIKAQYGTEYEFKYTHATRTVLNDAINDVVRGLGRTQQGVVDGYAQAINAAIAALAPNKFDVIFLDKNGAILLYDKNAEYKSSITPPTFPEDQKSYHDSENHYTYTGWDTNEYTSVIDDLVISPVYTAQAHDWNIETVTSTCVQAGTTKYTCKVCGFVKYDGGDELGEHAWEADFTIDLEPTCTVAGSKSIHCSLCDSQKDITPVEPLGHNFTSQSVAVDATCGKIGIATRVCDDCGFCEHTIIEALEHEYKETVVAPTCTTKGYTDYVCQRDGCGFTYRDNFTDVAPHNFGTWETVYEAACGVEGLKKQTCEDCGFIELETITALEHVIPTEWTVVVNPTCKGEGYQTKTCTFCGVIMAEEKIPALTHNYEITTTPATCTKAGETVETCSRCGDTNTTVIQPLGHDYDDGVESSADCTHGGFKVYSCKRTDCNHKKYEVLDEATANGHNFENGTETVIKEATCTEDGEKTVQCTNDSCEYKINVVIPKTGHKHVAGEAVESTCTASGFIPYTCSCGDTYKVYNEKDPAKGHEYNVFVSEEEATCTTDGEEVYKCSRCDAEQTTVLPKLGHNYELQSSAVADCTTPATETYKCSACADTYTEYIAPANGHTWGTWTKVQDATADKFGIEKRICTVDGCQAEEYRTTEPIGDHVFSGVIKIQPTCETEGTKVYTCTKHENCSADYEETLPATGHKAKLNYVAPTCTTAGSTQIVCETCTAELSEAQTIPAKGHAYGKGKVTTAPTCTEDGTMSYTCTACGDTITEVITKTGHNFTAVYNSASCEGTGSVVTSCSKCDYTTSEVIPATGHKLTVTVNKATCTTEGSVVEECTVCGETKITTLEPLEHSFTGDEVVIKDATCTENGEKTVKCSRCDETTTVIIPKLGHAWPTDWTVTENATCTKDGEETKTCANCKETITAVILKKGHNWSEWVKVDATNDTDGSWTRTCSNCNEEETVVIPKGGHEWDDGTVTKPATCEETGTMVYKCTAHENCGITLEITLGVIQHTVTTEKKDATCEEGGYVKVYCSECDKEFKTETTEKIAHTYTAGTPVPATCTTSGYTPYKCETCTSEYVIITAPANGHNYKEGVSTATCTEGGTMTLKCSECEVTMTADVPALGHDYVINSELSTGATCKDTATETYECSRCEAAYTVSVGSKTENHTYIDNWTIVKDATESSIGYKTRECTVCGKLEVATIDATGEHSFTNGEIVESKAATCLVNGYEIRKCANHADCGKQTTITIPATGHTEELYYTAATCAQAGSAIMSCKTCGAELKKEEIAKLDHSWANETITLSDCTNAGKVVFTCSYSGCNETKTVNLPVNENAHKLTVTVTDATCEEDGSVVTKCELCGKEDIKTIAKKGHTWKDTPAASTDATCEAEGSETYDCVNCDKQNTVVIPALGHIYEKGEEADPTCTTSGYTVYVCKHDENHTYNVYDATKPANGHDWSDWIVTTPATEEADGLKTRTCACGEKEEEVIPAMQHSMVEDTAAYVAPSCTAEGQRVYKCTTNHNGVNCTYTLTVTLPKIAHSLKTEVTDATCVDTGKVVTSCGNCDEVNIETEIPALGHNFTSTETVVAYATCDLDGEKTVKCSRCDETTTVVIPKLGHDYVLAGTTQASCDAPATENYECSRCDSSYVKITAPANGHQYSKVKGSSTATCTEAGEITLKCSACGDEIKTAVPALGHDYELIGTTDATCEAPATEVYKCLRCDAAYEKSVSGTAEHSWSEWKTTVEATEGSLGYRERECTVCGKTEVEVIPAIGDHSFTIEIARENVTCETDGYVTYDCAVHTGENDCGLTSTVKAPATGHNEVTTVTEATCIEDGLSKTVCTNDGCGKVIREEIVPATGHDWDEGTVEAPATCSSTGVMKYTCKNDSSHTYTQIIPSAGHAWDEGVETTQPTCTTAGVRTYTCLADTTHTYIQLIPVKGHSYGDWIIDEDATCTEDGSKHRVCENDDTHIENAVIPATGHDMSEWVVETEATCTEDGKEISRCANCEHYLEKLVPAKGHLWSEWKITEGDCLSGYTLGRICVTCSETQIKEVASSEHTYPTDENGNIIYDSVLSPTCTNEGMYYYDCEVCGGGDVLITAKTPGFEEELAAKGHKWIISEETDEEGWIITSEATCFNDGMKYRVCENGCGTNCGLDFESKETVIIPAEHLNWVKQGGKAATCTEEGYTEYYLCMDCGYITGRNKIAATGHTDKDNNSKCDICDTAISSGSSGEPVDCNCLCHETGGFKAFFFKIINFFWRLFSINPVCECGKAHY